MNRLNNAPEVHNISVKAAEDLPEVSFQVYIDLDRSQGNIKLSMNLRLEIGLHRTVVKWIEHLLPKRLNRV